MVDPNEIADRRHKSNQFSRTNTPLTEEAEKIGLAGELALANLLGLNDHVPASQAPTRGYQFDLGPGKKFKILTSRTPGNLFVKEGKVTADVYILAGITGEPVMENVYFVGWTHKKRVMSAETVTPTRKGEYVQPAHKVPRDELMGLSGFLHALDIDPENLKRFPLALNGHYVVHPKPNYAETAKRGAVKSNTPAPKPLPIKKPLIRG